MRKTLVILSLFCVTFIVILSVFEHQKKFQDIYIITGKAKHHFIVEIAKSSREKQKGLMYRTRLPENEGMLFLYSEETNIKMWMKNTYIPLDMIFINDTGIVTNIVKNTKTESEEIISSKVLSSAVLEINAGMCDKLGIGVGNTIQFGEFITR